MTYSRTLSWLLTVAAIVAAGLLLSALGLAGPVRGAAQFVVEPLSSLIARVSSPAVEWVGGIGSYAELRDEIRDLRVENERLRADLVRVREEQARAADAAELLNLRSLRPDDAFVFAAVIGRDPRPQRAVVVLNRGRADGIRDGMPVVGRGGALVGTVEKAEESTAWVRLITDPNSDVNAIVQESRALALAAGQPGGSVQMQFLAQGVEVKLGDTVLTSGLGGSYPAGLVIGRIAQVDGDALDTFKRARVEPAVRLAGIESVAVVTSFQPLRLAPR